MPGYILLMLIVLFLIHIYLWDKKLLKSIVFSLFFIFSLWINIPCFIEITPGKYDNVITMLPFVLYNKWGMLYIVFANIIMVVVTYLQDFFTNKSLYSYLEVKKIYDNYVVDAVELYIIGRDIDFLYRDGFERQTERIIHLKNKCKLLCESTKDKNLLNLYAKVCKEGVGVGFYEDRNDFTNLKGQVKIDQNGDKKAIFMSKYRNKYKLTIIDNQFLVSSILEKFLSIYDSLEKER